MQLHCCRLLLLFSFILAMCYRISQVLKTLNHVGLKKLLSDTYIRFHFRMTMARSILRPYTSVQIVSVGRHKPRNFGRTCVQTGWPCCVHNHFIKIEVPRLPEYFYHQLLQIQKVLFSSQKKTMVLQPAKGWFPGSNICINSPCWIWLCNSHWYLVVHFLHIIIVSVMRFIDLNIWIYNKICRAVFSGDICLMISYFLWSFQCEGINAKKRKNL